MHSEAGRWLRAGRVGRPHGLDGSFHVRDASPRLLVVGARILLEGRELTITRRAGDVHRPIIRLEAHESRSSVQHLVGQQLVVERSLAPELDHDEWWAQDLEGCAVHDAEREVGTVRRLLALPSVDVLEVERAGADDLLVPLVSDAVRGVDIEQKRIDVDLSFLGVE